MIRYPAVYRKLQARFLPFLTCLLISGHISLLAQLAPTKLSGASATQFVQQVINNELDGTKNDHSRFTYRTRKETPKGTITKQIIETNEGSVSRLVAVNDQAPTDDQRKQDKERIQKLINDPEERQRKRHEQQEDAK